MGLTHRREKRKEKNKGKEGGKEEAAVEWAGLGQEEKKEKGK